MLFLVLLVFCAVAGFLTLQHLDRKRWHRYQIERDIFFRLNPFVLQNDPECKMMITLNKATQKKLLGVLMLKQPGQSVNRTVQIQREPEQKNQQFIVAVYFQDFKIGELEPKYTTRLCHSLEKTDFYIGRPLEISAEISITEGFSGDAGCQVRLGLPRDPDSIDQLIMERQKVQS